MLSSEDDLIVVGEAADGLQAIAEVERVRPDVALLDAGLPNCDGIRATQQISLRVPECRVIVFSAQEDEQVLVQALEAGASGYLSKGSPLVDLIDATRAVHRGDALVPPRMLGALLQRLIHRRRERDEALKQMAKLTRREREVLALLAQGADNDGIAQRLGDQPRDRAHPHPERARQARRPLPSGGGRVRDAERHPRRPGGGGAMSILVRNGNPAQEARRVAPSSRQRERRLRPGDERRPLLNATATAIWVLCDGETTPDEMVDAICELSGLPREVVVEDVRRILLQFEEADILTWKGVARCPCVKPKVRDDLTVVELDGEAVIYDEETTELHHLNPTATIVFGLCDGTSTMAEMAADISDGLRRAARRGGAAGPNARSGGSGRRSSSSPTGRYVPTVRKVRPRNRELRSFLP